MQGHHPERVLQGGAVPEEATAAYDPGPEHHQLRHTVAQCSFDHETWVPGAVAYHDEQGRPVRFDDLEREDLLSVALRNVRIVDAQPGEG